jgi:hypothetical protein
MCKITDGLYVFDHQEIYNLSFVNIFQNQDGRQNDRQKHQNT